MPDYEVFTKEPYESFDQGLDFAGALKPGSVISTVSSVAATRISTGASVTSYVIGTTSFSGTIVTFRVLSDAAIVDGDRIKITVKITTSDSSPESHESGLICEVREI